MNTRIDCAFSPCPNDTFIFHALLHQLIASGVRLNPILKDVETLNQAARKGQYQITKLSFAALGHLRDTYALLRSGSALGRGCGPLIVSRPGVSLQDIENRVIAVPGLWTTAHLLLGLYLDKPPKTRPMPFDRIMPCIQQGDVDLGVIIHESRFTYAEYGLERRMDLGEWWEQRTSLPLPLGGIAVRRDIPPGMASDIENAITDSIQYAFEHPEASQAYIKQHAQEMDPDVTRKHIELYVNNFSVNIGREGEDAIRYLFTLAAERNLLPESDSPLFATPPTG